ncbi:MAG: dihydropteroate synthase [Planctomycetota bacterium]
MSIKGLQLIGESINDSIPSTKALLDANDFVNITKLAKFQDTEGADYIDVNVGLRSSDIMAKSIKNIQNVTAKPLVIDTPDIEIAEAGLRMYSPDKAENKLPILNSISLLRTEMLDLYKIQPFMPVLMASERSENGVNVANKTSEETYQTVKQLINIVRNSNYRISNESCIVDLGIAPIGSDTEGMFKRVMDTLQLIRNDGDLKGIHFCVGLTNFTVMLPAKRFDGAPVKSALENAFLTLAIPLGLDMIIGSVRRKYQLLTQDNPAVICLNEILQLEGFDVIMRIKEFYS